MNTLLSIVDGHTLPPSQSDYPSSVDPIEWPTYFVIPSSETHKQIRSWLFPSHLSRYAHFCRSAYLILIVKASSYASFERRIDNHITYTEPLLKSYLNALPTQTLHTVCDLHKTMQLLPDTQNAFEHLFPVLKTANAVDRIAAYTLMLAINPYDTTFSTK